MSFAAITLCVVSQRVFVVVSVYFVIDSVRKLLDTSSYVINMCVCVYLDLMSREIVFISCLKHLYRVRNKPEHHLITLSGYRKFLYTYFSQPLFLSVNDKGKGVPVLN
jgi:hypothetical protein